jgi:hypothetical protein
MARWKVEPTWKKSIIEIQTWTKEGVPGYIEHQIGWRWGEFFIETEDDNPPDIEEGVDILNCGYEVSDWSTDDGIWEETEIDVGDEEEQERIEEFLEENSIYDLESEGWVMEECSMMIECELDIQKVEE